MQNVLFYNWISTVLFCIRIRLFHTPKSHEKIQGNGIFSAKGSKPHPFRWFWGSRLQPTPRAKAPWLWHVAAAWTRRVLGWWAWGDGPTDVCHVIMFFCHFRFFLGVRWIVLEPYYIFIICIDMYRLYMVYFQDFLVHFTRCLDSTYERPRQSSLLSFAPFLPCLTIRMGDLPLSPPPRGLRSSEPCRIPCEIRSCDSAQAEGFDWVRYNEELHLTVKIFTNFCRRLGETEKGWIARQDAFFGIHDVFVAEKVATFTDTAQYLAFNTCLKVSVALRRKNTCWLYNANGMGPEHLSMILRSALEVSLVECHGTGHEHIEIACGCMVGCWLQHVGSSCG